MITTPRKIDEIKRWLPTIARKRGLDADLLMEGVNSLPVEVSAESVFKDQIEAAQKQISRRDPDDVDLLALALAEGIPIWSDDQDFEESSATILTTEKILTYVKELGGG